MSGIIPTTFAERDAIGTQADQQLELNDHIDGSPNSDPSLITPDVAQVISNFQGQARPYQGRIVSKVCQMFRGQYVNGAGQVEPVATNVMIESPTGSGKTAMALLSAKTLQQENPDLVVCWVAMRRHLLAQAKAENQRLGINVQNIHFVSMFDSSPNAVLAARSEGRTVLLVIDEAQHDAASSMSHLHNIVDPDYVLGMTATPFRTDRMKLCFQKVVKDCGIHQLIQDGYLSPYSHYTIPEWSPRGVAQHYLADRGRWGKSIFYFLSLDECHEYGRILDEHGISNEVVTGSSDKDTQIKRFEQGAAAGGVDVIINCMMLTEGFDCPTLKTAWVRPSGKGPTIQMAGRVFRLHAATPTKQVVQCKSTRWPMIRTAVPLQQNLYADGEWKSLTINPHIGKINHNVLRALATTNVTMPDFVRKNRGKRRAVQF